jgi:adenylate kinase
VKRRIVLLGPPASGKGTLADGLECEFGIPVVSPGALLRAERAAASPLGVEADRQTREGRLVDDQTINAIVGHWLKREKGDSFVFDGYPRTVGQAISLDEMLNERGSALQLTVLLEAGTATLRQRIERRATCTRCGNIVSIGVHVANISDPCPRCGGALGRRADDTLATLERRMQEYAEKTEPLINYYEERGIITRVNTERAPDEVFQEVRRIIA